MISKRTAEMTSFIVMDVLERANEMERQGVHIIHLEVGEPDFDTPACVKEAACRALESGHTHYTHSLGLFELRDAICEYYLKTYGVSVDPDQVIVTSGSSPAIFLVFSKESLSTAEYFKEIDLAFVDSGSSLISLKCFIIARSSFVGKVAL